MLKEQEPLIVTRVRSSLSSVCLITRKTSRRTKREWNTILITGCSRHAQAWESDKCRRGCWSMLSCSRTLIMSSGRSPVVVLTSTKADRGIQYLDRVIIGPSMQLFKQEICSLQPFLQLKPTQVQSWRLPCSEKTCMYVTGWSKTYPWKINRKQVRTHAYTRWSSHNFSDSQRITYLSSNLAEIIKVTWVRTLIRRTVFWIRKTHPSGATRLILICPLKNR